MTELERLHYIERAVKELVSVLEALPQDLLMGVDKAVIKHLKGALVGKPADIGKT